MAILDLIEWDNPGPNEMVHRVPEWGSGEFRLGSQLVVREFQSAVFFHNGLAQDTFSAGRYTLSTENIPLLTGLMGLPFGGKSPFRTEVYFVSHRTFLDVKWGTTQPVALRDPDLGVARLRAFGTMAIDIDDAGLFINKIVGGQGLYTTNDIVGYLRGIVVARLSDLLGESGIGLFDLPSKYDELAAGLAARLRDAFLSVGIALKQVYITNISATEETQAAIDERAAMGAIGDMDAYLKFKAARMLGGGGGGGGGAGDAAAAGMGLGAGAGMGAILAQMMGSAMQAPAARAGAPAGDDRDASLEEVFTGLQVLANRQLAVPATERAEVVSALEALRIELAAAVPDLEAVRQRRQTTVERWPWLADELEGVFRQPTVTAALVRAASRYTAG
ncbi:MAG: SPFH domain-containing protein [Ardenticatenales bacterium]|jgi:membrane protease subunit (stomatin/prohibitin family)|nr:SPFH domain-containing protein [Ardenticatenales bacterium]